VDGKSTCSREHGLRLSIVFWSKWALETSSVVVRLYSFNVIVVVFKSEVCFIYIRQVNPPLNVAEANAEMVSSDPLKCGTSKFLCLRCDFAINISLQHYTAPLRDRSKRFSAAVLLNVHCPRNLGGRKTD
jgi:hypothetical protein